jgi:hypothetical protein
LPHTSELKLNLPPHLRIAQIEFDLGRRELHVSFDDGTQRVAAAESVRSIHGARIHEEIVRLVRNQPPLIALVSARMAEFGGRSTQTLFRHMYEEETVESSRFSLAIRSDGSTQVWYLIADSFNFRKTLGSDCTYITEKNLTLLARRLAEFAPQATMDAFVTALVKPAPMPPAIDSLMRFLWTVARSGAESHPGEPQ